MTPKTQEYRTIPLTQGQVAIVDAADYDWLMQWKWYFHWQPKVNAGYARRFEPRQVNGARRAILMHRLILGVEISRVIVDHINRDTLDNRRINLRSCTIAQNACNSKMRVDNTSGFRGVRPTPKGKSFTARIRVNRTAYVIGSFPTAWLAAKAYDDEAVRVHGEFATLNFGRER